MKKAFSLAFFVIGLIALATVLLLNSPSRRGGEIRDLAAPDRKVTASEEPAQNGGKNEFPSQKLIQRESESLSKKFLNSQLPMEERLDAWLKLNQETPASPEVLTAIAISPNPFKDGTKDPHTVSELQFRREEGFRIMALQGLEKHALKNPASIKLIKAVARKASSPAVRKIAQKMAEFAEKGKSYSQLFEQAVMDLPIPQ